MLQFCENSVSTKESRNSRNLRSAVLFPNKRSSDDVRSFVGELRNERSKLCYSPTKRLTSSCTSLERRSGVLTILTHIFQHNTLRRFYRIIPFSCVLRERLFRKYQFWSPSLPIPAVYTLKRP